MPTPKRTQTKKASSRTRAQSAGKSHMVLPGRRGKAQRSMVIDENDEKVYGVLLSELRRSGESSPSVPESKTKNTQSIEAKRTARTGVTKRRRA